MSGIAGVLFPRLNEPDSVPFLIGGVVAVVSLVLLLIGFLVSPGEARSADGWVGSF